MDIFALLTRDHRQATALLNELAAGEDLSRRERTELLIELQALLIAHNQMEETVLYDALLQRDETRNLAVSAQNQHEKAEELLARLSGERVEDRWRETLEELRVAMERHIEEEERIIFAIVRRVFDTQMLDRMVSDMQIEQLGDATR
jgi:hemerythrin-like domain-containing protein